MASRVSNTIKEYHAIVGVDQVRAALSCGLEPDLTYTATELSEQKVSSYVGVFFNGNNPLLKNLLSGNKEVCILAIDPRVSDVQGTLIADRDVCAGGVNYHDFSQGLGNLDFSLLFNKSGWMDKRLSLRENRERKEMRSARLLIPGALPPRSITRVYVLSQKVRATIMETFLGKPSIPIIVKPELFFQKREVAMVDVGESVLKPVAAEEAFLEAKESFMPEKEPSPKSKKVDRATFFNLEEAFDSRKKPRIEADSEKK